MTGRPPPGSRCPAPAISLADPQSMKCVPPRSKTSRPGRSRMSQRQPGREIRHRHQVKLSLDDDRGNSRAGFHLDRDPAILRRARGIRRPVFVGRGVVRAAHQPRSGWGRTAAAEAEHCHVMRLPFSSIEQDSADCCQRASSCRKPGSSGASIDRAAGRRGLGGIMTGFSMPHFGQEASHSAPGAVPVWPGSRLPGGSAMVLSWRGLSLTARSTCGTWGTCPPRTGRRRREPACSERTACRICRPLTSGSWCMTSA